MYDTDGNGKVTSSDMLQVLRDLSGSFLTDEQRKVRGSERYYSSHAQLIMWLQCFSKYLEFCYEVIPPSRSYCDF